MPVNLIDPKSKLMKVYYAKDEVEKLVDEIVEEAEDWAGENIRVVADRILFEYGFEAKDASTSP